MQIEPFAAGSTISFTCLGKDLLSLLDTAKKLIGFDKTKMIVSVGKEVNFILFNSPQYVSIRLTNASSEGAGSFLVSPEALQGISKGRKTLDFSYSGKSLQFNDTKHYKGQLAVSKAEVDDIALCKQVFLAKKPDINLTSEVWGELRAGLAACALSDVHSKDELNRVVKISDGQLTISSHTDYHMVLFKKDIDTDLDLSITIKDSYFSVLESVIGTSIAVDFFLDDIMFYAHCPDFGLHVVRPPIQAGKEPDGVVEDLVDAISQEKGRKIGASFDINKEDLETTISNLSAIHEAGANVKMVVKKDRMVVSSKTSRSNIADVIKLDLKGNPPTVYLDRPSISDILRIMPKGNCTMNIVVGSNNEPTSYMLVPHTDRSVLTFVGATLDV